MPASAIETLGAHLHRFDPRVLMNDDTLGRTLRALEEVPSATGHRDPSTIYLVDCHGGIDNEVLVPQGNYLVLGADETTLELIERQGSNAVFVGATKDEALPMVEGYLEGLRSCVEVSPALVGAMVGANPVRDCMDAIAPVFENPIGLWASDMSLVGATSLDVTGDPLWDRMVSGGENPRDFVDPNELRGYNEVARSIYYPSIQFARGHMGHRTMVMAFTTATHARYYLFGLELVREFTDADKVLLNALSLVLATTLSQTASVPSREEQLTRFVGDALAGTLSETALAARMRGLGIEPWGRTHLVLAEPVNREDAYVTNPQVIRSLRKSAPNALVAAFEGRVIAATGLKKELRHLCSILGHLQNEGYRCAMSQSVPDLPLLCQAYEQCRAALQISRALGITDKIARYEDYALLDLLRRAGKHFDTSPWVLPQAREMALHDAREGTSYVDTLREYAHCRDRNEVARRLFIHPNTASYRIRRASELFGIDLQDDNQIARMLVSFAIMRIEGV